MSLPPVRSTADDVAVARQVLAGVPAAYDLTPGGWARQHLQAAADAALKEEDLRPFLLDAAEQVSVALGLELDEGGVEEMAGASLDSACARRSTK